MDEAIFQTVLEEALEQYYEGTNETVRVRTFADVGVLTNNTGLVVTVDGSEFQVTIVQSK